VRSIGTQVLDTHFCMIYGIHSIFALFLGILWTDKTLSVLDRHAPNPSGFDLTSGKEAERCGVRINEVNVTELCAREECQCGLKGR
jgi:hypothetical protein